MGDVVGLFVLGDLAGKVLGDPLRQHVSEHQHVLMAFVRAIGFIEHLLSPMDLPLDERGGKIVPGLACGATGADGNLFVY